MADGLAREDGVSSDDLAARRARQAEYSRRYRERLRERSKAARGYSWAPFERSNEAALVHGGSSARYVDPLAAAVAEELLAAEDCPPHVREARFRRSLLAWARQEAIASLIASWVAGLDLQAALAESVVSDESSSYGKGGGSKRVTLTRLESAVAALDRAERRAQSLRNDLLITPASAFRARLEVRPRADIMVLMQRRIKEREAGNG